MNTYNYAYTEENFNPDQLKVIQIGIDFGLDVSLYAKPEFTWQQMLQLEIGLSYHLDISNIADPNIPWDAMKQKMLEMIKST